MSSNSALQHLCAIAAFALADHAAGFEYKGVPLGATEAVFKATHSSFSCGPSDSDFSDRTCVMRGGAYAGVPVKGTTAQFEGNRLCRVNVVFAFDHFIMVKDALTEAFGPATKRENERLPASAAPHKTNWIFKWTKGRDHVALRSYVFGFNSLVELSTDACLDDRERLRNERRKRRAKDL